MRFITKKKFGQNFLKNHLVVKKIVKALELGSGETVIEIGAGRGVLTEALLETGASVAAIEKDRDLFPILEEKFAKNNNFFLVKSDVLDFALTDLPAGFKPGASYKVCGNLPYYLSGKILTLVLEKWSPPEKAVFMLQKEVCQRLLARPPRLSILAVISGFLARFKILFFVSRQNFLPQPKVDSAVLEITPKAERPDNFFALKEFVKTGFVSPRKYLLSNLSAKLGFDKNELKNAFARLNLSEKSRPGEITPDLWLELFLALSENGNRRRRN